ncbi:MAG: rhodanese-like domain-containing protein [Candidatus Krumholzibacteriia bacterium]
MSFLKSLLGGVVIIAIAAVVGVVQNSVRSKPVDLFPKVPKRVARKAAVPEPRTAPTPPTDDATKSGEARAVGDEPGANAAGEVAPAGPITADEYESGELGMNRLRALLETGTVTLLDARSEQEFAEGHLPGAINIPYDNFTDYYAELDDLVPRDADVVTYCRSVTCELGEDLARELQLAGYERVIVYRGGWEEWTEANFPTEGAE